MNSQELGSIMSKEEFEQKLRDLATPIDFDSLIRDGILEKHGSWYKILSMERLPSWAKAQIKQLRSSNQKETLVKFQVSTKRAERMLRDYEARKKRNGS